MDTLAHDLIGWTDRLATGDVTARALTEACLRRMDEDDPALHAVSRRFATVLAEAEESDRRRAAKRSLGVLDGVPILLKDNIEVAGEPATAGMASRRDRRATADAIVVARLRAAGAVLLGHVTMHEAALGATNESPLTGRTFNPHRAGFTPGGSSGGSAAAVAAGFALTALGTDTLGSVRIPAAYCGVVGLKPTRGLVSTRGVVPLSYTLDHVGPIARSLRDVATLMGVVAAPDLGYADTAGVGYASTAPRLDLKGLVLGRLGNADDVDLAPAVRAAFATAINVLADLGASVRDVRLPGFDFAKARRAGLVIAECEGAHVHAEDLAARAADLSPQLRAMLGFGQRASAVMFVKAERLIADVVVATRAAFAGCDAIVLPTAPQPAFAFGAPVPDNQADLTSIASLTGRPALSLPMGWSADGLPMGLQFVGAPLADAQLLSIAAAYERAAAWDMRPKALR